MEQLTPSCKILLIDNYDSFTYNLYHYLILAGATVVVRLNDDPTLFELAEQSDALVISPGPSDPQHAGDSKSIIQTFFSQKPILGICLGMQVINEVFGGKTIRAPRAVHGKACQVSIRHSSPLFHGLATEFTAARYHSLICTDIPDTFLVTATYKTIPMALQHKHFPLFGLQFHPESFLTPKGQRIINNFVKLTYEKMAR